MDIDMSGHPFIGGILIGLVLALPTGPGAFMVINQGIGQRMSIVFKAALVCMVVDLCWNIALCAFGTTSLVLVSIIDTHKELIKTSAGPILLGVAAYAYRSIRLAEPASGAGKTFVVALFNPLVPVTLTALTMYIVGSAHFTNPAATQIQLIAGVFIGEAIMWVLGIRFFNWLMLKGLPERGVSLFFVGLFLVTGTYLTLRGLLS